MHIVYWYGCYQSTIFPLHYFILAYLHDDTTLRCAWYVTCDQLAHRQNKFISTFMQIFLLYCFLYFLCRWLGKASLPVKGWLPFSFYFLLSSFYFRLSPFYFLDSGLGMAALPVQGWLPYSTFYFLLSSFYFLLSTFDFLLSSSGID